MSGIIEKKMREQFGCVKRIPDYNNYDNMKVFLHINISWLLIGL